ncbi:hypothetical protein UA08_04872 [Talaromyces atroroseus]|uniref:Uncharacterized protein n=1 Tax=Talaromyces atroroseus TaxID=1441469 RepID=A0A225AF17_TALAT|nr:hypothetical protein UA08_04872 [Talaromyces atroroseus]OKL59892.1 hypothetical protein UA08_04872 [Talaromyces atroroseus]
MRALSESFSNQDTTPLVPIQPETLQREWRDLNRALGALIKKGIPVVEWGNSIMHRWGLVEIRPGVEWGIPDSLCQLASQTLVENDFPVAPERENFDRYMGGWIELCTSHDRYPTGQEQIHLYRLSTLRISYAQTVCSTFNFDLPILTPCPSEYWTSLVSYLQELDSHDPKLCRVEGDLGAFISRPCDGPPANTQYYSEEEEELADREFEESIPIGQAKLDHWHWHNDPNGEHLRRAKRIVSRPIWRRWLGLLAHIFLEFIEAKPTVEHQQCVVVSAAMIGMAWI